MQEAITLPYPVVTAPPVPALCRHCGAVRRTGQLPPVETTWEGALVMWSVLLLALAAGMVAAHWVVASGVLGWLP